MFERAESDSGMVEDAGPTPVEIDSEAILTMARSYRSLLMPMTDEPEHSETHSDAASVLVWGSAENANLFHSINPADSTQSITFPPDTLFVKEHFDEGGATIGMTVMYKGPAGYNPQGRDWYWAHIRDDVVAQDGHVDLCMGCHEAAYNTDFVVGFSKSQ